MQNKKRTILTFTGGYLPGYTGGGTIRSIANLVEVLGNDFNFKIVTLDRDLQSRKPYSGIQIDAWQRVGNADVFYLSPGNISFRYLRRLIASTDYEIMYLNSFFSPGFTIMPLLLRRFGQIGSKTIIIAPRGEFSPGALQIKSIKKKSYFYVVKKMGLYRDVIWQASSDFERNDIKTIFEMAAVDAASVPIIVAPDLARPVSISGFQISSAKKPGQLKMLFLSRISPKKNLLGALEMLNTLQGAVTFNIFGPLEDGDYWKKCQRAISGLPPNVQVQYQGVVDHARVADIFAEHDLFFFPTLGENFGHVIIEALSAGCPIVITDRTPWRHLEEAGVGWDIPLEQQGRFVAVLQQCIEMGNDAWRALAEQAREYGLQRMVDQNAIQQNRLLFSTGILEKNLV
jgi:glycosyltransferase involved in cell wall biosynthesis